jgi:DNA-binding response OmpR family regulator
MVVFKPENFLNWQTAKQPQTAAGRPRIKHPRCTNCHFSHFSAWRIKMQSSKSITERVHMAQLLLAEDDTRLACALAQILEDNGYAVDVVHNGQIGVEYAQSGIYDAIIADVMMPEKSGIEMCTELRRAGVATPLMLLTALDDVPHKITGYDSGADDYMTKPFAPSELLAHLRALLRRQSPMTFEERRAADLTLNLNSMLLTCQNSGKSIQLSQKESDIFNLLAANPNIVLSKETILTKAWGWDATTGENNVEAYISFLRKKLAHIDSAVTIDTIRRAGYKLNTNSAQAQTCAGGAHA